MVPTTSSDQSLTVSALLRLLSDIKYMQYCQCTLSLDVAELKTQVTITLDDVKRPKVTFLEL